LRSRASRAHQKNFNKPVEWVMAKRYPWQEAILIKQQVPTDIDGNPWPLDEHGKPSTTHVPSYAS